MHSLSIKQGVSKDGHRTTAAQCPGSPAERDVIKRLHANGDERRRLMEHVHCQTHSALAQKYSSATIRISIELLLIRERENTVFRSRFVQSPLFFSAASLIASVIMGETRSSSSLEPPAKSAPFPHCFKPTQPY